MADNPFEIPQQVREQAEKTIALTRQFYEQWMDGVTQVMNMWSAAPGGSKATAQFGILRDRAARFSKENAEAAFALAEKLAHAKDLQQLMTLQSHFIQKQLRSYTLQARELGDLIAGKTGSGGSEVQSKAPASPAPPAPPPSGPATPPGVRSPEESAPGTRKKEPAERTGSGGTPLKTSSRPRNKR